MRGVDVQDHARRPQGDHRPERRRQDHAVQSDHRHLPVVVRARCCCSARTSPSGRATTAPRSAWRARSRSPACFPRLTVLDNVLLAIKGLRPSKFVMWRFMSSYRDVYDKAHRLLEQAGFMDRKDTEVRNLSHGEQRQLEIVLGLASDPKILLLDEPAAGLSSGESTEMTKFLMKLDPNLAILLIEHDMDVVFDVADEISVLHFGEVLETGHAGADQEQPAASRKSIWGPRLSMAILEVQDIHTYYGDAYVLQGLSLAARAGPDPRPARPQRRRQDHAGEFDRRLHSAAPRQDRVQGQRHHPQFVVRDRAQRHGPGAAGPPRVPDPERRGKPPGRRAQHRAPRLEPGARLRHVPAAAGAAQAARQDAVRRRAADAGDRPRR